MMNSVNSNYSFANAGKLLRNMGQSVGQKASTLGSRLVTFLKALPSNIKEDRKIAISAFVVSNLAIFAFANGIRKGCDRITEDRLATDEPKDKEKLIRFKKHVFNVIIVGGIALTSNLILSRLTQVALSRIALAAITATHIVASYLLNRETTPTVVKDPTSPISPTSTGENKVDHPPRPATSIGNDANIDDDTERDNEGNANDSRRDGVNPTVGRDARAPQQQAEAEAARVATEKRAQEEAAAEELAKQQAEAEAARIATEKRAQEEAAAEELAKQQAEAEAARIVAERIAKEQTDATKIVPIIDASTEVAPKVDVPAKVAAKAAPKVGVPAKVAAKAAPKVGVPAKAAPKVAAKQAAVLPAEEPATAANQTPAVENPPPAQPKDEVKS